MKEGARSITICCGFFDKRWMNSMKLPQAKPESRMFWKSPIIIGPKMRYMESVLFQITLIICLTRMKGGQSM